MSATWCLQAVPPEYQLLVVWEPAIAMRRCEMKKVFGIYNNPDRRCVGYGFPVLPLFLLRDLFRLRSRTTMSMPIKAVIPIFLGLFIAPAQAPIAGTELGNPHCPHRARPRHDPCCGYPADPRQGRRNHRFLEQPSLV